MKYVRLTLVNFAKGINFELPSVPGFTFEADADSTIAIVDAKQVVKVGVNSVWLTAPAIGQRYALDVEHFFKAHFKSGEELRAKLESLASTIAGKTSEEKWDHIDEKHVRVYREDDEVEGAPV